MRRILIGLSVAACLVSCRAAHSLSDATRDLLHSRVVAKVGRHKLHLSELEPYIPAGTSREDSLALALQYIQSWAVDRMFVDMAEAQLSKDQLDVSRELEEYRVSLLKYRYEQLYINERLDTTVSMQEVTDYYEAYADRFVLDVPVLRARYMVIAADSPALEVIKRKMSSYRVEDVMEADSLAWSSAQRYEDWSDTWIDAVSLAREFGIDHATMLSRLRRGFIELPDGRGNVRIAYVTDMIREGRPAPLEYCVPRIEDIILTARKHALVSDLERDLLEDARTKDKLVIY